ncbi:MAG: DUF4301 family protein [Bacteroidales bacterium]|nr:DUF4301 family protein [Bacteroidales bacterium]MCF8402780.1 DUF4301 family protein [Bacteroidales bacterium]
MFTQKDLDQFKSKGISIPVIENQIENFKKGFPFSRLVKPATINDGINNFNKQEVDKLVELFNQKTREYSIVKFVPASGAASRMFKALYTFLEEANENNQQEIVQADTGFNSVFNYAKRIKNFAFFNELNNVLNKHSLNVDDLLADQNIIPLVSFLVEDKGLGYGNLPKGLLLFHQYGENSRLALEEHLVESAEYALDSNKVASVHFTVSPEHMQKFKEALKRVLPGYESKYKIKYKVEFSIQKPSTDTIAVDMDNNPFRENGSILFRPAGHGALIENLNDLVYDIVFIKNIDNIVPDRLKPETIRYKKVIGGLLMELQKEDFFWLKKISSGKLTETDLSKLEDFAVKRLNIKLPEVYINLSFQAKTEFLYKNLNRPIRICGMVKNEGEPGGGPFWVKNSKDEISLQIVESSQINMEAPDQVEILNNASHFNPVDLVCSLKDFKGNRFDLHKFTDPETGFISVKSKSGKNLKAQELPGLWNGAQADWITIFVEVPLLTFNPVKTVNDLLRDQHQPG